MYNLRNMQMISISEHQEIYEDVNTLHESFTEEQIDQAEFYDIEEDPITLQTSITLYDLNGAALTSVKVNDYDVAVTYMEENFDLDHSDDTEVTVDDDAAAGASRYGHA